MFKISYSPNLKWEVKIPWSKNAALPIVAANFCIDGKITLQNKPDIIDIQNIEKLANEALVNSKDYFDLTSELATKIRASILLIPLWLLKYWKVKFVWTWWCKIWKRPLDTFDNALLNAGVKVTIKDGEHKFYEIVEKPKKNIMVQEFSVTTIEALLTYLAFLPDINYEITIYQAATEPHVKNLIDFLNNAWAKIKLNIDHTISIQPIWNPETKQKEFKIISDYIQAWTYFAIWAGADNSELIIKNCNIDDLSAIYNTATKIWINFKIIDKNTIQVNSLNKSNYRATKFETRIFPWFPTDLQSIFWTLLTQANWISKIFETMFEWRFWYLNELENLWANIEILNPHQALIIWPTKLKWGYVSSTDLRWWGAMVLAWIMASGTTYITREDIILRWYDNIENNLKSIWVNIERTNK